jgi:hypothetical protein
MPACLARYTRELTRTIPNDMWPAPKISRRKCDTDADADAWFALGKSVDGGYT